MIGLSTTYYATKGCSIYDSVLRAVNLGFDVVELGTAHMYEDNAWDVLHKIKRDFPDSAFSVHNLFPPLKNKTWFNPADDLCSVNKKIIDRLFKTASILGALVISIHPPVLNEICLSGKVAGNFDKPKIGKPKDEEISRKNFTQFIEYINKRSEEINTRVLIENMSTSFVNALLSTKDNFLEIFDKFDNIGLLLDVGHALQCENLHELLELNGDIFELHLHDVGETLERKKWAHLPVKDKSYFEPLKKITNKNSVLWVFEHGADVFEDEILEEKKLLEKFLGGA